MCRLLGYLGSPIILDYLLYKPEHSLIVQSYKPREMMSATLNADGFGVGWYHPQREAEPFTYKNTLPIWNDTNLPSLSRYIESGCVVANIRSATAGLPVDLSNCHPFQYQQILFTHNGFIENFRQTLYRPIRDRLNDIAYQAIYGLTDSEHIFALLINELTSNPGINLVTALHNTLNTLTELANSYQTNMQASLVISDGHNLIASRFAINTSSPSLYWLRDDPTFPDAVIIASEPLFSSNWNSCPENSIITVGEDLDIEIYQL